MKYFFDTEFIEDGPVVHLVSLGVVSESGREFYLESSEAPLERANAFVVEHVLPQLGPVKHRLAEIRCRLESFVKGCELSGDHSPPQFVAWYATYDWYLICRLFGGMLNLPKGWRQYCLELQQVYDAEGNRVPSMHADRHNALVDARWCRDAYLGGRPYGRSVLTAMEPDKMGRRVLSSGLIDAHRRIGRNKSVCTTGWVEMHELLDSHEALRAEVYRLRDEVSEGLEIMSNQLLAGSQTLSKEEQVEVDLALKAITDRCIQLRKKP